MLKTQTVAVVCKFSRTSDADAAHVLKEPSRIITVDEHQILIQLQNFSSSRVSGSKMTSNLLEFSPVFPSNPELFPCRSPSLRASRARKPRCSASSWVRRAALSPPQMCWRRFRRAETSRLLSNTSLTTAPSARSRCPSARSENTAPFLLHIWSKSVLEGSSDSAQISLSPALIHLIRLYSVSNSRVVLLILGTGYDHDRTPLRKVGAYETWAITHARRPSWPSEAFK